MNPEGTVFIVDDDPAILKSMARLLEEVAQPSATFQSARAFLEAYDPAQPGCLLVDVRMPGMSGIELHKTLIAQGIKIPVIVITGHGDVPMAAKALRRGAVDFIEKPLEPQQLLDRIQEALARDAQSRRVKAERDAIAARLAKLTPREREVVDLAVSGMTNKGIAAQFGVSSQAIDSHRVKAMAKMSADSVPELVKLMLTVDAG